jgi:hypothetical protein
MSLSSDDQVGVRLRDKLMKNPRASNCTRHGVFQPPVVMAKTKALQHRLVQFNGPRYVSYLVFDVDREEAVLAWQDANLPRPTLIIENPFNRHAHYAYELATPVKLENEKSARYAHAIREAMCAALRADPDYRGNLTKNPFHPNWRVETHDHAYTFAELTEYLDLDRRPRPKSKPVEEVAHSRNLTLAKRLRTWAYANVRFYHDQHSFEVRLTTQANEFNAQFARKLSRSEITKWVRGTARWTWTKFTEGKFRSGYQRKQKTRLLDLPIITPLRERQQIGQEYAKDKRVAKTEDKIESAIRTLQRDSRAVNKSSVARQSCLSRPTVIAHFNKVMRWIEQDDERERKLFGYLYDEDGNVVCDSVGMDSEDPHEGDSSVNNLSESGFSSHIQSSTLTIDSSLTSSVNLQRHADPTTSSPTGSEIGPVTKTVTEVEKLSAFGTSLSLVGYASGEGVTIGHQTLHPLTPTLDTIHSYVEVQQLHDDGSKYGNVTGIVRAMIHAREMATRYGIVLIDAPSSQRPNLERLAAEQAGMTLPPPLRIKRRTGTRVTPCAAVP